MSRIRYMKKKKKWQLLCWHIALGKEAEQASGERGALTAWQHLSLSHQSSMGKAWPAGWAANYGGGCFCNMLWEA